MAEASAISPAKVHEIWQEAGLAPHRMRRFKLSTDPAFAEKLEDVIGLYVDPPRHAIVLSLDEKSQVQALDRTQPGLPMKPGRAGTMTHDYKRNGTTTLFAALNVLDGTVVGRCMQRHRHQELLRFLNAIERQTPPGKVIHVILDNYAAHKHPNVRKWLARHPRWVFHFTPTSCSWLNAIEGFFAKLTRRRLKRGVFRSLVALRGDQPLHRATQRRSPTVHLEGRPQSDHRRRQARASNVGNNPLGRVNTKHVGDQGQMDEGGEHEIEVFEAGEDAANAFEPAEQALDLVAPSVEAAVVGPGVKTVGVGRHDRLKAELQHQLPGLVAVVDPVHHQQSGRINRVFLIVTGGILVLTMGSTSLDREPVGRRCQATPGIDPLATRRTDPLGRCLGVAEGLSR